MSELQGTDEWRAARLGKATASRIADATARLKGSNAWGATRANYMADLIAERLTGVPTEGYVSSAMAWGTEKEPEARAAYAFMTDTVVEQIGFIDHPRIAMSGCSPDGFVGEHGLVQFKCPLTATHIETLLGGSVSGGYIKQIQWELACTGRQWCDFCSFDPRLPAEMQLFIKRVPRDDAMITTLEKEITEFLAEVAAKVEALT